MNNQNKGAARYGTHRGSYERARKKIFATQTVCGICGRPVDFSLRYPHPMSACIDHIVPVAKGGSLDDMDNLQLAHWCCNRAKSDKLPQAQIEREPEVKSNRDLPQHADWYHYRRKQ